MKEGFGEAIPPVNNQEDGKNKEGRLKRVFKKFGPLAGDALLAGGIALHFDGEIDEFNQSKLQQEREEIRRQKIEQNNESIHSNLAFLENHDSLMVVEISGIKDSVDRLKILVSDLEKQKEKGEVSEETMRQIKSISESIVSFSGPDLAPEVLQTLDVVKEIKEDVETLSNIEKEKKLVNAITNLIEIFNDEQLLSALSEHPRLVMRIIESIDAYKEVFAAHYISPNVSGDFKKFGRMWIGQDSPYFRVIEAFGSMDKDGSLEEFFKGLGNKINLALINSNTLKEDNTPIVSLKNFVSYMKKESGEYYKNNKEEFDFKEGDKVVEFDQELIEDWFVAGEAYFSGSQFFLLFAVKNEDKVKNFIDKINKSEKLTESQKSMFALKITQFGKEISELVGSIERDGKTISWDKALEKGDSK
jgi:hypothetical protein